MARLVRKAGGGPPEIEVGTEKLTIGRRVDNRVRLDDTFASSRHAAITLRTGSYWLEDLNSSNGTFLNGARVSGLKKLKSGDRVTIGKQDYEFVDEGAEAEAASAASAATAVIATPAPAAPPTPPRSSEPTRIVPAGINLGRLSATDVNVLDALVGSIRSHREKEKQEKEAQQALVREQWKKMLTYAEQLKVKIGKDPRLKYFSVSPRANDILIRFQRTPHTSVEMLYLSLEHPDQKNHALAGIWLRRTGEADRCLESADEAATELVKEMAFLIA